MTQFKDLQIGDKFFCNTTPYTKKSSRTAWLNLEGHAAGKWFYFGQNEIVKKRQ